MGDVFLPFFRLTIKIKHILANTKKSKMYFIKKYHAIIFTDNPYDNDK
jgi:hypothetical protein